MSQVIQYPASTRPRAEKAVIRLPKRPTIRLPKIGFWPGFLTFAIVGSAFMVWASR